MRPEFLDGLSWEMAEVYGAISDQILINLAKYFPVFTPDKLPGSTFAYQADMLAQMGQVNAETMRIIRSGLKDADKALQGVLETAIIESIKSINPDLYKAAKAGIFRMPVNPVVAPNQMQAFQLYYHQAADKLNLVNTVMLESTQQAYTQAISDVVSEMELSERFNRIQISMDTAAGETITGVSSWNTALKHATDRMKENGITGFVDHAGRHWSAEAYAAMDIRTATANTARAAVWEQNENFGNDLYLVSYHNGARPLCFPYQNKVVSSLDRSGMTYDLDGNVIPIIAQKDTTYGQPAGLFGINCKHYPTPFIPGVTIIRGEPQDKEENDRVYAESQQQRALERKIREEKRDLLMMKARGVSADEIKAQREKIRKTDDDIDAFCAETGRARRQNREGVYTKREFPSKELYDPATFVREQKEQIDRFFASGGDQTGRTFGKVNPNTGELEVLTPKEIQTTVQNVAQQATQTPVDVVQSQTENAFTPAKTRAEAEEYARQHFANNVDFSGMNIENANKINETLTHLTQKYPIQRLEHISQTPQGSVARANFKKLEINGKKLGKALNDETINFKINQAFDKNAIDTMRKRYEGKPSVPWDVQRKIERLEIKLKFSRFGVQSSYDDHVRVVVTHEYGHILSDQYFGISNHATANPHYDTNWQLRGMEQKWQDAYKRAIDSGDIFNLSEYGSTNFKEFFAESFAAREMGEVMPDYVESLFDEVFKNGIM